MYIYTYTHGQSRFQERGKAEKRKKMTTPPTNIFKPIFSNQTIFLPDAMYQGIKPNVISKRRADASHIRWFCSHNRK